MNERLKLSGASNQVPNQTLRSSLYRSIITLAVARTFLERS
jgi:hypothetical protein